MQSSRIKGTIVIAIVGAVGGGAGPLAIASAAEDYGSWTHHADVTLNTSATGADVPGVVTAFPLLVRLSASNFNFSEAKGSGQDLRFSKPSGDPLSYQIERWDSAGKVAEIWVRMDTVPGNTSAHIVKMHWGKPTAEDSSNGRLVFDTADGFAGVWHLNEEGSTIAGNYKDATYRNANGNGIAMGSASKQAGMVGFAQSFDGTASSIAIPALGSGTTDAFTISAWVHADTLAGAGAYNVVWSNINWSTNDLHFQFANAKLRVGLNGGSPTDADAPFSFGPATWYHLAAVYDSTGKQLKFYVNGALNSTKDYETAVAVDLKDPSRIGAYNSSRFFKGRIDELEISRTVRSGDWIRLSHANQKPNQSLVTIGKTSGCVEALKSPGDTALDEGAHLVLRASTNCAQRIFWEAVSGPVPKVLDPEAREVSILLPRVVGDTLLTFRLTAVYSDSISQRQFRVVIKERIPDPIFEFPGIQTWNGRDSLAIRPMVTNLAAIQSSPAPAIRWVWTISGTGVDADTLSNGILLKSSEDGTLRIRLCLDNGGAAICKSADISVAVPSAIASGNYRAKAKGPQARYDAIGRRRFDSGIRPSSRGLME